MKTGADFLVIPIGQEKIFTKECFTGEEKEIVGIIQDFFKNPNTKVDGPNWDIFLESCKLPITYKNIKDAFNRPNLEKISLLLKQLGNLGLLAGSIPARYAPDSSVEIVPQERVKDLVTESFASVQNSDDLVVATTCHKGIGTLAILYFGTEYQRKKYLPKLASGEFIGAYALTEPGSGSDAQAAKTKAVLSADGKYYVLNGGTKQFITNAGIADIFTVFAQVDGDKFTAFIVEKDFPGISMGLDEHKMGLHSSTTRQLILENVKVPVENVIGGKDGIGNAFKYAMIVLTQGRKGLAAACVGSAKKCIREIIDYTGNRRQFGISIREFDALKKKIADCVIGCFLVESAVYRLDGVLDDLCSTVSLDSVDYYKDITRIQELFTIEASILKVFGSEMADSVANHGVQCAGGYGYTLEYPFARHFTDLRINEIWEGTNEINRQVIAGFTLKSLLSNILNLTLRKEELRKFLDGNLQFDLPGINVALRPSAQAVEMAKLLSVYLLNEAICHYGRDMESEQQIFEAFADILGNIYLAESSVIRASQCLDAKDKDAEIKAVIARYIAEDLLDVLLAPGREILYASVDSAYLVKAEDDFCKLTRSMFLHENKIALRREIAEFVYEQGKYPW